MNLRTLVSGLNKWSSKQIDRIASRGNRSPLTIKKIYKQRWKTLLRFSFLTYPILLAVYMATPFFAQKIGAPTTNFVYRLRHLKFSLDIDWTSLLFWIVLGIWIISALGLLRHEDVETDTKFDRIWSAITKAPNHRVFQDGRFLFAETLKLKEHLDNGLKNALITGDKNSDEAQKLSIIATSMTTFRRLLIEKARLFFNTGNVEGANFMLYIKNSEENKNFIKELRGKYPKLYFREKNENDLLGILYLDESLMTANINTASGREIPSLILPVYNPKLKIYNCKEFLDDEFLIPGAIQAVEGEETSMVGDCKDINKFYPRLNECTKDEVREYFKEGGKNVRSFSSFRVADPLNGDECVAVLNLDSSFSYAFGVDIEFFEVFFTIIYPSLALISPYLQIYKEGMRYLVDNQSRNS